MELTDSHLIASARSIHGAERAAVCRSGRSSGDATWPVRVEKTYRLSDSETVKVIVVPGYPLDDLRRLHEWAGNGDTVASCYPLTSDVRACVGQYRPLQVSAKRF
jgi:hypothetical protein